MTVTCSVGGCSRPVHGRGWCRPHYMRWWRHGDAHAGSEYRMQQSETCAVNGCDRATEAKGWCSKHYHRWLQTGDPLGTKVAMYETVEERFLAKIDRTAGPEACWPWLAYINADGYGTFSSGGEPRTVGAHVWAYERWVGPVPDGMQLDHLCHGRDRNCPGGSSCLHRRCANPAHLEPVTCAENVRRGASSRPRAEPQTVLPPLYNHVHARKTHCPKGHPYDAQNTYLAPRRRMRMCRTCHALIERQARAAKRQFGMAGGAARSLERHGFLRWDAGRWVPTEKAYRLGVTERPDADPFEGLPK